MPQSSHREDQDKWPRRWCQASQEALEAGLVPKSLGVGARLGTDCEDPDLELSSPSNGVISIQSYGQELKEGLRAGFLDGKKWTRHKAFETWTLSLTHWACPSETRWLLPRSAAGLPQQATSVQGLLSSQCFSTKETYSSRSIWHLKVESQG